MQCELGLAAWRCDTSVMLFLVTFLKTGSQINKRLQVAYTHAHEMLRHVEKTNFKSNEISKNQR